MTDAKGIVGALAALRKTGNATVHAQPGHAGATAGEHLVGVSLMADVPHQTIVRRIEYMMQGDRQFHRPEVRRQVAAGPGDRFHQESAQLVRQLRQLSAVKLAQLHRIADGVEKRIAAHWSFLSCRSAWC
jgi:hypothetical protein